jgi:DNA-binding LytR/AlgR family response regulator
VNKTLEELEQSTGKSFFRVNRQYLINRKAVIDVTRYFSRKLLVNLAVPLEEAITVSKEKSPQFLAWLESTL